MRQIYFIAYLISSIVVLFTIFKSSRSNKPIVKSLLKLFLHTFLSGLGYLFVLVSANGTVSLIAYSIFFVGIDWITYYLLEYTIEYTGYTLRISQWKKLAKPILLLDSASMLLNPYFKHAFTCFTVTDSAGDIYYRIHSYLFYNLHLCLTYSLILISLVLLIIKYRQSSTLYRAKYASILFVLITLVAIDACYVFLGGVIDLTVLGFVVGALVIYYLTVVYIPREALDRMLSMVTEDIQDSIMLFDTVGNCLYANKRAYEWIADEHKELCAATFDNWYQNEGQFHTFDETQDIIVPLNNTLQHLKVTRRSLSDSKNIFIGSFFHVQNVTDEYEKLQRERYFATHDRLTGLYNKEMFFEKVEEYLTQNPDTEYLILCSDIHNFKLVNDVFGTDCGDAILVRIADALRRFCSSRDVYARIGNDHFGLLMPKKYFDMEFFRTEPNKSVYVEKDMFYPLNIYIGIYDISERTLPISVMYDRAQFALRGIKGSYQEHIAFYDNNARNNFLLEQEIMGQFETAINSNQFQIYLQPQVTYNEKIYGAEALVRWIHPEKGFMPPGAFISIFEKNDTIVKLDRHVWELACAKLKDWQNRGFNDMYISVNISPKDFFYIDVYENITFLVNKYGISPKSLHLEITETSIMTDVEQRIDLINRLRNAGFIVEMDDFGSGYSSLNTLKDINFDTMKIDMAFLRKATEATKSQKILTAMIKLAKDLKISTLVEGVETFEQVQLLKSLKCDAFQGYYFAKPMPVNEFEEQYMNS